MKKGSKNKEHQWVKVIADILELSAVCPHDNTNPPFCPLYKVRKLQPNDRINWVLRLSVDEMEDIIINHGVCLKCRSKAVSQS